MVDITLESGSKINKLPLKYDLKIKKKNENECVSKNLLNKFTNEELFKDKWTVQKERNIKELKK